LRARGRATERVELTVGIVDSPVHGLEDVVTCCFDVVPGPHAALLDGYVRAIL
jgi:hypothetical protein